MKIREALRKALPAPPEQFFTVMVPGKVLDIEDFTTGFDRNGAAESIVLPLKTQLKQAILCDDMPALAPIQLGPTGKSVSHSYDAAISKLIPAGTTVGVDITEGKKLSDEEERYSKAMKWLTFKDLDNGNQTRVELYTKKQTAYTKCVEAKTKAFNEALEKAMADPRHGGSIPKATEAYNVWVSENARTYRNLMQAAYMDWVVNGLKEEVEYWFSIVDRDSSMARVEASKETMRAAVVEDMDGSGTYPTVRLTPENWAVLTKNKMMAGPQGRTAEWYTWEITRLEKMNSMLLGLKGKSKRNKAPVPVADNKALDSAMSDFLTKREAYYRTEGSATATPEAKKTAYRAYTDAQNKLNDEQAKKDKDNVAAGILLQQNAQDDLYDNLTGDSSLNAQIISQNEKLIKDYTAERNKLVSGSGDLQKQTSSTLDKLATDAGVPAPLPEPKAKQENEAPDFFTSISVEVSSASSSESQSSSASSFAFGASVNYGLFKASASGEHTSSASEAQKEMAKSAVKISFDCMRVDIARSWLRAELFYDADLKVGDKDKISPGFGRLNELLEGKFRDEKEKKKAEEDLESYSQFPMYPTAFLLATNIVLEISGETSKIQSHFKSQSTSGKVSASYGPFVSATASGSKSSSSSATSSEATATGCRITIRAPQIIGWISQMVPALPRLNQKETKA